MNSASASIGKGYFFGLMQRGDYWHVTRTKDGVTERTKFGTLGGPETARMHLASISNVPGLAVWEPLYEPTTGGARPIKVRPTALDYKPVHAGYPDQAAFRTGRVSCKEELKAPGMPQGLSNNYDVVDEQVGMDMGSVTIPKPAKAPADTGSILSRVMARPTVDEVVGLRRLLPWLVRNNLVIRPR